MLDRFIAKHTYTSTPAATRPHDAPASFSLREIVAAVFKELLAQQRTAGPRLPAAATATRFADVPNVVLRTLATKLLNVVFEPDFISDDDIEKAPAHRTKLPKL